MEVDGGGFLYVVDRKKDVIKTGGFFRKFDKAQILKNLMVDVSSEFCGDNKNPFPGRPLPGKSC